MGYLSVEHQKTFSHHYKMAVIIVLAFCLTVLINLIVAKVITSGGPIPGSETWMRPVYAGVLVLGLMVVIIRRLLLSRMVMKQVWLRGIDAVLGRLLMMTVLCSAMAEIVAIAGLVFYLVTGDYQYSWRLGGVSLFLLLYSFPRRGEWEQAVASSAGTQSNPAATTSQSPGF